MNQNVDLSVVLAMLVVEYGGELRISQETIENQQVAGTSALTLRVDEQAMQWVIELEKAPIPGELAETEDEDG